MGLPELFRLVREDWSEDQARVSDDAGHELVVDALTGETVSFLNLKDLKMSFWTDYGPITDSRGAVYSGLFKYDGFNDWANTIFRGRAWAVRDGDVLVATVPEPSTLLLLLG